MTFSIKRLFLVMAAASVAIVSCQEKELDNNQDPIENPDQNPDQNPDNGASSGISNIQNRYEEKTVSFRGETVTLKFDASASWTAELKLVTDPEKKWAGISSSTASGEAKEGCSVRIVFEENKTSSERVAELWVTVEGFEAECIATLTQASAGTSGDAKLNRALNTYMHDILKEDYLFADAYNAQEVDLTVNYNDFLATHLLSLGDVNVADGGYYRATQPNPGQRFIYTNIVEIQNPTKSVNVSGFGFGPFISTALSANSNEMAIAPSYVRRGSPAELAGLRRGDLIYAINGFPLTKANYYDYMVGLYQGMSGSLRFSFLRFEENGQGGYELNAYETEQVNSSVHVYDPVIYASIINDPDNAATKIAYLVYESFDLNSQEFLEDAIRSFKESGITEMILDLRFNAGGAVAQSRWLSGCIAGEANGSKTFTKVVYNDGKTENWTFDYGYDNDTDNLGKPLNLGLKRLYVITSYNTASAAELVISSLKGIDFPIKMIGCRTEGKNVGMTVSETTYNGRRFHFSPVTFWVRNAKDWGDYPNGIEPDEYVNNDNNLMTDDADNVFPYSFSDWGNMDYNIALQWAYCDIIGKDRWTNTPTKSSSDIELVPVDFQQIAPEFGRYGNMIQKINN